MIEPLQRDVLCLALSQLEQIKLDLNDCQTASLSCFVPFKTHYQIADDYGCPLCDPHGSHSGVTFLCCGEEVDNVDSEL